MFLLPLSACRHEQPRGLLDQLLEALDKTRGVVTIDDAVVE
jgi:hypothetical protein